MYPGGTIVPIVNACLEQNIIVERFASEQGAGYAALAYARLTGRPQIFMVTSGPGVTNAISPLADAFYDSLPLILISGQIGTKDLASRPSVRQRGFQEVPTVAITAPISKHSVCLDSVDKVFEELPNAFALSASGRMGPVVLDFPMDIQRTDLSLEFDLPIAINKIKTKISLDSNDLDQLEAIAKVATQATRPVILLGHGAIFSGAYNEYRLLAEKLDAVVTTSFLGLGAFNTTDRRSMGYIGHTGHFVANTAVAEADFLLVLGSRLDVRQTGTLTDQFVPKGKIVWVDIDETELNNPRVSVDWAIKSDVSEFCAALLPKIKERKTPADQNWFEKLHVLKSKSVEDQPKKASNFCQPKTILSKFSSLIEGKDIVVTTGVGCHQHWAARHLPFAPTGPRLLTSGGHGTMGFDLPSAIGAAIAEPNKRVLCIVGDGSLLMNIQELMSVAERNLNIKILVLNNNRLGIVSQFQLITWGDDPASGNFCAPDFQKIALGFGIPSYALKQADGDENIISDFWNQDGPGLLNVSIDPESNIVPMLLAGQKMNEMWTGNQHE